MLRVNFDNGRDSATDQHSLRHNYLLAYQEARRDHVIWGLVPGPIGLLRGKLQPMTVIGALVIQLMAPPTRHGVVGCIKPLKRAAASFFGVLSAE